MKHARLIILSLILAVIQPAHAQIGIGDITSTFWGAAWTIGDLITGETTLTPAYVVESYYRYIKTIEKAPLFPDIRNAATYKMKRDRVTGQYFYYAKYDNEDLPIVESEAPFPIPSVNKMNRSCTKDILGVIFTDTEVESHTEFIWMARVETTGFWPDNGPWTVWLKTAGGDRGGCVPRPSVSGYYWIDASIGKSGGESVSIGVPNCVLNFPFYLANDFYK